MCHAHRAFYYAYFKDIYDDYWNKEEVTDLWNNCHSDTKFGGRSVVGIMQKHTRNSDPWQTVKVCNTDVNCTDLKSVGFSSDSKVSGFFYFAR